MQFILIVLELNTLQNKLINSYETKISKQIFVEYKHTMQ